MRPVFVLAVAVSLAAGCFSSDPGETPETPAATNGTVDIDPSRPDPSFGEVTLGPLAPPDLNATLDAPPRLQVGEWWKIRFTDPFTGESVDFVRVIADIQDGKYVVGMPHEGWYKEAVIFHAPGFGDVNEDLSYNTHDHLFQPVVFPLTEGQTWTTTFSGGPEATASVKVLDDKRAEITFTTPDAGFFGTPVGADGQPQTILTLTYDASIHEVSKFEHPSAVYEVVEHGYGFEGWITVPRGERLVFFHGAFTPAFGFDHDSFGLDVPVDMVQIAGGFNRVTFIQASSAITTPPATGAYMERAVAPDGTAYETMWAPHPGGFQMQFYEHADPDGNWELTHLAGGPGVTFIEGIAYHQYDIRLPDGAIRSDHSHEVVR